jgi:demethoxyubiquinone hydroxylase (CLK1/Coq7/Cat5 family)
LCYKVDTTKGSAKFDKTKKTLTIRVPVVGSTDASEKVLEQHYRDYAERQEESKERLKHLKKTQLDEVIKECRDAADQENEDPNEYEKELDKIEEALSGVG